MTPRDPHDITTQAGKRKLSTNFYRAAPRPTTQVSKRCYRPYTGLSMEAGLLIDRPVDLSLKWRIKVFTQKGYSSAHLLPSRKLRSGITFLGKKYDKRFQTQIDQPVYRQACFHRQAGFEPRGVRGNFILFMASKTELHQDSTGKK
ncbi:hypothetical protein B0H16DRAFT_1470059 [Mycena metata]|uniref:Uncharacterized protein n=1 Tax=Mycena metata TaxID=1033252 RepID=A0AAD7HVJ0_9AGAR|nr:hypothetical protein B0H16DRAFT_1470059 [Mycena metata]